MYNMRKMEGCLAVEFKTSFDYGTLKTIMHNFVQIPEHPRLNELYLIGNHRARIRLGEIQAFVEDYGRLLPKPTRSKKIAMVVDEGLTEAIVGLMANGLEQRHAIKCRIFRTMEEAGEWLDLPSSQVA